MGSWRQDRENCCYEIWILEERAGKMKKDKEAKEGTAVYSEDSCLAYFSI